MRRYLLPLILLASTSALADPRTDCPDANPCKIVMLTAQEEKILLDERGILATAAQARQLDLAGLVAYFQQKIIKSPAGDVKEAAKPPLLPVPETKPAEAPKSDEVPAK